MDFVQFDVSKYKEYKDYWLRCDEYSSDMSFIILWAWKDFFGYEIAWEPELLWMRQTRPDQKWLAPVGDWHRDDWGRQLLEHVGPEADFIDVPKALVETMMRVSPLFQASWMRLRSSRGIPAW